MTQSYTPVYYSSFQDSIASLCKSILPFSLKKRGLPAAEAEAEAEAKLSKEHSDYLKWQQESFHQILNLMGLNREGILPESEVSHFKAQLLLTLTANTPTASPPPILRDKLLFLQELLYAKCISDEEYQTSKRALLKAQENSDGEEWSVIDLGDDAQCLIKKNKPPASSSIKQHIKGAASVLGFGSSAQKQKQGRNREEKSIFDETRRESVLMPESSVLVSDKEKRKKKKGFLGFVNNGADTRQINRKQQLGSDASASEFFTGDNIKKELTRIQAELSNKSTTLHFSNDEMETISTKLPTDKADLHKFFPKSWCEQHGEVVLDVVKKEFNGHVARQMDTKYTWPRFDDNDNENSNPNLFPHQKHQQSSRPLLHSAAKHGNKTNAENKLMNQSFSNPFWNS